MSSKHFFLPSLLGISLLVGFCITSPGYASEKVLVQLKDGGKIIGQLKEKKLDSITIKTKRMEISIQSDQVQSIQYMSTGTQINNKPPPPGEKQQSSVIDHKTCGDYRVLCNRKLIILSVDPTLKHYRHTAPKKMCDNIGRVCKELKFQFQPVEKLDFYYNYALQCFTGYLSGFKNALKSSGQAAEPQQIATWYTNNAETVTSINDTFTQCLENGDALLYKN